MDLRKVLVGILASSLLIIGAGCSLLQPGLPDGKTPEQVISDAMINQKNFDKGVFEMNVSGDVNGEVDGEKKNVKGTVVMDGTADKDQSTLGFTLKVDGTADDQSLKADMELRVNSDGVFAHIKELEISEEEIQTMVDEFLKDYMGIWVKLSFMQPADLMEVGELDLDIDEPAEEPFNPFTDIQYKGTKNILGLNSYHFTAKLDEEAILAYMKKKGERTGDAEEALEAMDFVGDIYVGVDDNVITGVSGTLTFDDPEVDGTVTMDIKFNPTKADTVETPKHEREITEEDVAALLFGGAMMAPDPSMMDDEMMFDDSMMEDLEGMEDIDMEEFDEAMKELEELQLEIE